MADTRNLHVALHAILDMRRLTAKELADRGGLSPRQVTKHLTRESYNLGMDSLTSLVNALDVTHSDVFLLKEFLDRTERARSKPLFGIAEGSRVLRPGAPPELFRLKGQLEATLRIVNDAISEARTDLSSPPYQV